MGKIFQTISPELRRWMGEQHIFFVATAPLSPEGHVNCSPKGGDTLRVVAERELAYLDLTGSGVETIAHIQENRRIVVMLCAFSGAPRIVRLHGEGETLYPTDARFPLLRTQFPDFPGIRAIVRVTVTRISDSCGMSVPFYDHVGYRDQLDHWAERKGDTGLADYRREKNSRSIDDLEGYKDL